MQPASRPGFLNYLLPKKGYITIPVIFLLNLIFYLVVSVYNKNFWFPSGETISKFGGNATFLTLDGEWWRLITSTFLHFGLLHFAANMFALVQIGFILEDFIGSSRLAAVYFFTGLTASMSSTWWHSWSIGAGASGAIFGLFGFFLALVTTPFIKREARGPLLRSIGLTVLVNILIGTQFNFDNAAHLGGLFSGIFSGYLLYLIYKAQAEKRILIFNISLLIFSGGILFGIYPRLSREPVKSYPLAMKIEKEKDSLINKLSAQKDRTKFLSDSTEILDEWNKLLNYSRELSAYKLDKPAREVREMLASELKLRKKETELIIKLNTGNISAKPQLEAVQKALSQLMKQKED